MVTCCTITYLCIVHFAPYIYSYKLFEVEEVADIIVSELSKVQFDEAKYYIPVYCDVLSEECDDEYVFHIFKSSGEELILPSLDAFTGKDITDYKNIEPKGEYYLSFADSIEEYILLLTRNTNKESQVIEALQKSLPILSVIIFVISAIVAFFYTWYMTKPIKRISKLSKQMADMDFSGLCIVNRTDEIGVLSYSLNDLSEKLVTAISELQEANKKLQADIDKERQLEKQRVEFFQQLLTN